MKTIILPGYSPHNRDWALDIKKHLNLGHEVLVHEWLHWPLTSPSASSPSTVSSGQSNCSGSSGSGSTSGSFSVPREIEAILEKIGDEKVNIVAKSVGTRIALQVAGKIPDQINKIILCGIPTKGESQAARKNYAPLADLSPTQGIVFQNTKDPFASYSDIKKFMGIINPKIKIIEKPRSDHHYPYPEDFQKFLSK